MSDLSNNESTAPSRSPNEPSTTANVPYCENRDIHDRHLHQQLEEAPDPVTFLQNTQAQFFFNLDYNDSDDDGNQDWTPRLESETPPNSPRNMPDTATGHETGEFACTIQIPSSDTNIFVVAARILTICN